MNQHNYTDIHPAHTRHSDNVGLMLANLLRRWANIKPPYGEHQANTTHSDNVDLNIQAKTGCCLNVGSILDRYSRHLANIRSTLDERLIFPGYYTAGLQKDISS